MKILDILKELENTSKTNEKISILKKYKENNLLHSVMYRAFNPRFKYYMKAKTLPNKQFHYQESNTALTLEYALEIFLQQLNSRTLTGQKAIDEAQRIMDRLPESDAEVLRRIILRDLKCGVSAKTVNKIWKNIIPSNAYMRCSGEEKLKNITYPAIIQEKADGVFCNMVIRHSMTSDVNFITRNGTEFSIDPIIEDLKQFDLTNVVLIGEMLVLKDKSDEVEERKDGNGLINKVTKENQTLETITSKIEKAKTDKQKLNALNSLQKHNDTMTEIKENIILEIWDIIPLEEWENGLYDVPYKTRINNVLDFIKKVDSHRLKRIPTKKIENEEEARSFNIKMIEIGKEGSIVKNMKSIFKNGTSTEQIKLKAIRDADLICIGWYHGRPDTDFADGVGGLNLESADGKVKVNVGSGLSRCQRGMEPIDPKNIAKGLKVIDGFDFEQYVGRVIEIQYNELIQSDNSETYSLFLPRFVELREDKDVADTLEKLLEG